MRLRVLVFFVLAALAYVGMGALVSVDGSSYYKQFAIGLCVAAVLWLVMKYSGFGGDFFAEKDKKPED